MGTNWASAVWPGAHTGIPQALQASLPCVLCTPVHSLAAARFLSAFSMQSFTQMRRRDREACGCCRWPDNHAGGSCPSLVINLKCNTPNETQKIFWAPYYVYRGIKGSRRWWQAFGGPCQSNLQKRNHTVSEIWLRLTFIISFKRGKCWMSYLHKVFLKTTTSYMQRCVYRWLLKDTQESQEINEFSLQTNVKKATFMLMGKMQSVHE